MKHFSKFAAIAALSLVAGSANAATLTYNTSFSGLITNFTGTSISPAIPHFNESLGTLTGITITMSSVLTSNVTSQLIATSGTLPATVSAQTTGTIRLLNPFNTANNRALLTLGVDSGAKNAVINTLGGSTNFGGAFTNDGSLNDPISGTFNGVFAADLVDNGNQTYTGALSSADTSVGLGLYNLLATGGPGATTTFTVTGTSGTSVVNTAGGTSTFQNTITSTASGTLRVVYTYTANQVTSPEPASMALLALGAAGFIARRRRTA